MSLTLPASLVSTDWLAAHLHDPALRIFDCTVTLVPTDSGVRLESGRAAWAQAHIPGSGYADLLTDLSDASTPLPMMMPPAVQFADVMGRSGIGARHTVVLYDAGAHTWATRVWWMLRAMGFDNAAVLDGGLKKWQAEGRVLSAEPCTYPVAHEHSGKVARTARPGRIQGSGNVPAGSLLDSATGAYFALPVSREMFAAQQALDGRKVITYCGGGITATSAAFTLMRLGVSDVAVYDGSLVEWSQDPHFRWKPASVLPVYG